MGGRADLPHNAADMDSRPDPTPPAADSAAEGPAASLTAPARLAADPSAGPAALPPEGRARRHGLRIKCGGYLPTLAVGGHLASYRPQAARSAWVLAYAQNSI